MPPHRLAVAYAPKSVRRAFSLLLEFDARLSMLVATASEPMIGQLKLAWWRDALAAEPHTRPKGEPMLRQLALLGQKDVGAAMAQLVDAWEVLLVSDHSAEDLAAFAEARSESIFGTYARLVGSDANVGLLGEAWAIGDLTGSNGHVTAFQPVSDRKLKPLTILALSVSGSSGPRLLWHALTGR